MNHLPVILRDTRGNVIPRPAYEGWKPEGGNRTHPLWWYALSALALAAFAWGLMWL